MTAECQQSRSQLHNRDTAMRVLRSRLYQSMLGKESKQRLSARKQQVRRRLGIIIAPSLLLTAPLMRRTKSDVSDRWERVLSQSGFVPTTSAKTASQTTGLDTQPEILR